MRTESRICLPPTKAFQELDISLSKTLRIQRRWNEFKFNMKGTNKNYQKEDNKNNESLAACKKELLYNHQCCSKQSVGCMAPKLSAHTGLNAKIFGQWPSEQCDLFFYVIRSSNFPRRSTRQLGLLAYAYKRDLYMYSDVCMLLKAIESRLREKEKEEGCCIE